MRQTGLDRIERFLDAHGWADATWQTLAGDASARRYIRLSQTLSAERTILMVTPHDLLPSQARFVALAGHLRGLGLSAPEVLADAPGAGLTLLEDLGDDLFARLVRQDPAIEPVIYGAASDLLSVLGSVAAPPGVPLYDAAEMAARTDLAPRFYTPGLTGTAPDAQATEDLRHAAFGALARHAGTADTLALRDYHAENLLWLPDRAGHARVGLLDFQDAVATHPAYDLVSLLDDVRRDVPEDLRHRVIARFARACGTPLDEMQAACAVLSAQRNIRILGVFARLALTQGKTGYVALIPRAWGHITRALDHPACAGLRRVVAETLPAPTAEGLSRLQAQGAHA